MGNPATSPTNEPTRNPWRALLGILTDPATTFSNLGTAPPVWPSYIIQSLAGLAATALVLPATLRQVTDQLAASGAPPEAIAIGKWSGVIGGVIGAMAQPWIAGVGVTVLALLVGLMFGGEVSFRAYFGMIGYARVPLAITAVLGGLLATRAETMAQLTSMSISPAAFLASDASPLLRAALSTLNPFSLWYYVLLAIGFATLHRAKPIKGAVLSAAVYLLALLMAVAGVSVAKLITG